MLKHIFSQSQVLSESPRFVQPLQEVLKAKKPVRVEKRKETLLNNRNALVTNCTPGSNSTKVAISLANYGASVLLQGECENTLSRLLKRLPVHHPNQRHGFLVDSMTSGDLERKVQQFTNSLEIIVHDSSPRSISGVEEEQTKFDDVLKQHLSTPFAVFNGLLPLIQSAKNPSVIFSTKEVMKKENDDSHIMMDFGMKTSALLTQMLSKSLSQENIRVNSVVTPSKREQMNSKNSTSAYVWLSREDTQMDGQELYSKEWEKRDPTQFKSFY